MPTWWITIGAIAGVVAGGAGMYLWVRWRQASARPAPDPTPLTKLGSAAGGLAHEIKNPLSTIGLNVQLLDESLVDLQKQVEDDSALSEEFTRLRRRLSVLNKETDRLRDILQDFLQFAGRMQLDRVPTDLNALVDELVDFFSPQASAAKVNVRPQLDADPAEIEIDAGLIKQAVLNLMINAVQVMSTVRKSDKPNGGCDELMIRTQRAELSKRKALQVRVIDTGPGIEQERLEDIFQPYYSSRKGGTGLGLPTSRRIAEEHGGTLEAHSELGRGTEFVLTLPLDGRRAAG